MYFQPLRYSHWYKTTIFHIVTCTFRKSNLNVFAKFLLYIWNIDSGWIGLACATCEDLAPNFSSHIKHPALQQIFKFWAPPHHLPPACMLSVFNHKSQKQEYVNVFAKFTFSCKKFEAVQTLLAGKKRKLKVSCAEICCNSRHKFEFSRARHDFE